MRELASVLFGTALAASFIIASIMPSNAAPAYVPRTAELGADVEKVNYRRRHGWRSYGHYYRDCYNCGRYWGRPPLLSAVLPPLLWRVLRRALRRVLWPI